MDHELTTAWVADGAIELTEGETLDSLWVSTHGEFISPIAQEASQGFPPGAMDHQWQPRVLRMGLLWVDNPLTIVDPLSSLANALWVTTAQWQFNTNTAVWSESTGTEPIRSRNQWIGSHNTPNEKMEGKRTVTAEQGSMWITFNGSESDASSPFLIMSSHSVINAVVSALVMLPEGS